MKIEKEKNIKRLLKGANAHIIVTDKGIGIEGSGYQILPLFSMIVQTLKEDVSKKELERAFELGLKSAKELEEEALKVTKEIFEKIMNKLGDEK